MRTIFRVFIFLILLIAVLIGLMEIYPHQTAKLAFSSLRSAFGLEAKTIDTDVGKVHYLEGGKGETILMLHGVYADKNHWVPISGALTDKYRLIMIDIPGFGDNAALSENGYAFDAQAERVEKIINALKLDKFHIAGNSMGGQLAGMIATKMPDRILSTAFIGSPAGVKSPIQSDMEKAILKGKAPLRVTDKKSYHERKEWLFPNGLFEPRPVARYLMDKELSQVELNKRIWDELLTSHNSVTPLLELAPQIEKPSLVVWCKEDRIFHFTGAAVLTKALPKGKLVALSGCGHLPYLDKPWAVGDAYRSFLNSL